MIRTIFLSCPGTMLIAYVASIFCNVAILPGCAVTFNVVVNPTEISSAVINDTAMGSTLLLRISPLYRKLNYKSNSWCGKFSPICNRRNTRLTCNLSLTIQQ